MRWFYALLALLLLTIPAAAQRPVTEDEVHAIAEDMYCPVCENEPLDDCRNVTCMQWKAEIRNMLSQGMTEDQIVADFIARYGQQVVSVPRDPTLLFLSFAIPAAGTVIMIVLGVFTFLRWRRRQPVTAQASSSPMITSDDPYRRQVEQDIH